MGSLFLNRVLFKKKERKRRRRIRARKGSFTTVMQKEESLCDDGHSQGGKRSLPEDIWCYIHSLMPLQDSARSACVSRTFLRSWRCYPNLTLTEETLGLKLNACREGGVARTYTSRVDHILRNHSSVGVKTLKLIIRDCYNFSTCHLNTWLQNAITPGIEKVDITLPSLFETEYNFPCSILFNGRGNSIRYLRLTCCAFRPTVGSDCLRSLTNLHLSKVCITGDELGHLISHCFALEQLHLSSCNELICLKIPFWLEQLSCLVVYSCKKLQVIDSRAPNLSTFKSCGNPVQLSLGESSQVNNLHLGLSKKVNIVSYAFTTLPSIVPHLETLNICSIHESIDIPMAGRFLHLKSLNIYLTCYSEAFAPTNDYLSSGSFLDGCPVLENFILSVHRWDIMIQHVSDFWEASDMRQITEHKHDRLKNVLINGFYAAKSMVELTFHILENATSLERLTLDTIFKGNHDGNVTSRCRVQKTGKCFPIRRVMILEAHKALRAFKRYISGRVPSRVKLNVGEPCSLCHAI
ncbi:hypothetical protein ACP4OV_026145 [Aristida adscensionis]